MLSLATNEVDIDKQYTVCGALFLSPRYIVYFCLFVCKIICKGYLWHGLTQSDEIW